MNDPHRLNLLAAAGPARFAGNSDYRAMMGPVEDAVLEEVRRRQLDPIAPTAGTSPRCWVKRAMRTGLR